MIIYNTTSARYINHRWENPANNRYYTVYFSKDLFGDWIMIRTWGRKNTSLGRVAYGLYESFEEGENAVLMISKKTRKKRILSYYCIKNFLMRLEIGLKCNMKKKY